MDWAEEGIRSWSLNNTTSKSNNNSHSNDNSNNSHNSGGVALLNRRGVHKVTVLMIRADEFLKTWIHIPQLCGNNLAVECSRLGSKFLTSEMHLRTIDISDHCPECTASLAKGSLYAGSHCGGP